MTQLLDLPPEILREILCYGVDIRGIKRGLRLRLVNRLFGQEVVQALYESRMLRDYFSRRDLDVGKGPEYVAFWQSYFTQLIMSESDALRGSSIIRGVAERLLKKTDNKAPNALRCYVQAMCFEPDKLTLHTRFPNSVINWDETIPRLELQAAIINNCPKVVCQILENPNTPTAILDENPRCVTDFWRNPVGLAARLGNMEILQLLLSTTQFTSRDQLRWMALGPAIRGGHLQVVEYIMDPRWGPIDFFMSAHCVDENLFQGMLKSPLEDFSSQLFALFDSYRSPQHPIEIHKPNIKQSLHVSRYSPQRVDVVECLLDQNVASGQAHYWHTLQQAVQGGNEKIVRLLLSRGATANHMKQRNEVLSLAIRTGRLDIVRMLVDVQSDDPSVGDLATRPNIRGQGSFMALAVATENETLCHYLIENGADVDRKAHAQCNKLDLQSMARLLREHDSAAPTQQVHG